MRVSLSSPSFCWVVVSVFCGKPVFCRYLIWERAGTEKEQHLLSVFAHAGALVGDTEALETHWPTFFPPPGLYGLCRDLLPQLLVKCAAKCRNLCPHWHSCYWKLAHDLETENCAFNSGILGGGSSGVSGSRRIWGNLEPKTEAVLCFPDSASGRSLPADFYCLNK